MKNATIKYLINLIINKKIIEIYPGDILLNNIDFYLGYKIEKDTVCLFKSPVLCIKLFQSIINLQNITIIESNLFKKKDIDNTINFLNSLDENEYKYKLTYIKSGIITVKLIENNSINLLKLDEKQIIKIIENNISI